MTNTFDVEEVLSKLDIVEKISLLSGLTSPVFFYFYYGQIINNI